VEPVRKSIYELLSTSKAGCLTDIVFVLGVIRITKPDIIVDLTSHNFSTYEAEEIIVSILIVGTEYNLEKGQTLHVSDHPTAAF
jgi:hypothetical protein